MTEFDQLIKEKAESKSYPYSAKSWHSFAKKAGLKPALSGLHIAAISAVGVAAVATTCFLLGKPQAEQLQPQQPAPAELAFADTAATVLEEAPVVEESAKITENEVVKEEITPKPICQKPAQPETIEPASVAQDTTPETPKRAPILRPKNPRKILVINTDTIPTND